MSFHRIFCLCVDLLEGSARAINRALPWTQMDYVRINVLIFCILWPLLTAGLAGAVIALIVKPSWAVSISRSLRIEDEGLRNAMSADGPLP